ncbi:hypothetical protein SUDANB120_06196 (plasmid) [Streptomyces sp. enrichment culture]|uniref:hypothetical protein n=1 Tax=Streptomyces sp. enrichment culture TaxID=1795815 RepID=UPI003F57DF8F
MPQPEFRDDDFSNPEAPEEERHLRLDHPRVRDLSYERSRGRQAWDLWKGSLIATVTEPWDAYPDFSEIPEVAVPGPSLTLFVKERPRGAGYVADFVYEAADLPVTVDGVLVNQGAGLGVIELELWRPDWGSWDDFGDFVGPAGEEAPTTVAVPITGDVLRRIPLGQIVAQAQAELASPSWKDEGVTTIGIASAADRRPGDLAPESVRALENAEALAQPAKRGRPPLEGDLLHDLAHAYLREAGNGPGLHRRLGSVQRTMAATAPDAPGSSGLRGPGAVPSVPSPTLRPMSSKDFAFAAAATPEDCLPLIDSLAIRPFPETVFQDVTGDGGPDHLIRVLHSSRDFWDVEDPQVWEKVNAELSACLDALLAVYTARWGDPLVVDLWAGYGEEDRHMPEPLCTLSQVTASMHAWPLPDGDRWLGLALGQADKELPMELLVAVGLPAALDGPWSGEPAGGA